MRSADHGSRWLIPSNFFQIPARRSETRRRETRCPGQFAAAATPAKAAAMFDVTNTNDDPIIAKYATHEDHSGSFTQARLRKRRSDEAFPASVAGNSCRMSQADVEMVDADTSVSMSPCEDASTQTMDAKEVQPKVNPSSLLKHSHLIVYSPSPVFLHLILCCSNFYK